ncbi:MAG: phage portal protein [Bdellovibrionota bacterium]
MSESVKALQDPGKTQETNRTILKAIVIGKDDPPTKDSEGGHSQTLPTDTFNYSDGNVIEPPYDLLFLTMIEENSSFMGQLVDAMEINIEAFGGRIQMRELSPKQREQNKEQIEAEKKALKNFLLNINPDDDLTMLRRKARHDLELTGNGYFELIPARGDHTKITALNYVEAHTMRITVQDDDLTPFTKKKVDEDTGEIMEQTFLKRFRRFVQKRNNRMTYFKEWGDPRIVDRRDGKAFKSEDEATKAGVERKYWANPVLHFKIHSARSPYGIPRYIGNLFSIFGSRGSEEINYTTILNNNVPSLLFLVSGNAMLTEGTIKRMEDFANNVLKRTNNRSKFLVIEAEPAIEGMANSSTAKIEVKPLKEQQHNDMLFQTYDKNNSEKIRSAFRIPGIFVGKTDDINRATAEESRKLAEEQIFAPERREMDRKITQMFLDMGYQFWIYKSFSPNVTNDEDLIKMANALTKVGSITPNDGRKIKADIMNEEVELYDSEKVPFDPDIPFPLTMAEAVKGEVSLGGNPNSGPLAPNQGQIPNRKRKLSGPLEMPDALKKIRECLNPSESQIDLVSAWEERLRNHLEGYLEEADDSDG